MRGRRRERAMPPKGWRPAAADIERRSGGEGGINAVKAVIAGAIDDAIGIPDAGTRPMVYPTGGNVDGIAGDNILLAPPFIVDQGTVDAIVERLGDAIDAAIKTACGIG